MQTSQLHTLEDILTTGVKVEGQADPVPVVCVYIPKIQRAYAQGRETETDVRNDFLDALFEVLVSEKEKSIELSFLFGSKQPMVKREGEGFELLDGQQRTTTLFLLYWYMSMKEKKELPDFLSNFTYETRDTSIQFLKKITSNDFCVDLDGSNPSKAIKDNKWFTDDFYCDPTVCAMLNMLDSIDVKYKELECSGLFERLNRLRFYVLMLEKFDMNDELYIKMNSRGLSLVPFENFKASIVKYMKSKDRKGLYGEDEVKDGNIPFWFDFTSKIDAKWIDLFWKYDNNSQTECTDIIEIDDISIGNRYLNFFNRYFFTKAILKDEMRNSKLNVLTNFFYNEVESDKMKKKFFGWENYENLFSQVDCFNEISKVLDVFHECWDSVIKEGIENDPYDNVKGFDIKSDKITLPQRVVFAAVIEFIKSIPDGKSFSDTVVRDNYKRMLRVVFNIIENTDIGNPERTGSVIKACAEIIGAPGATYDNFYKTLATKTFSSRNQQLSEEIEKAKAMFPNDAFDQSWENVFVEAERHPFFKGSVLFFFTSGMKSSGDFQKRYQVVKELFDKDGISKDYRDQHVLIRAIIGTINFWNQGLKNRYITENAESEKYLKQLLTNYKEVRSMFCQYFCGVTKKSMKEYLNDVIAKATPQNIDDGFALLFNRLVKDTNSPALFDWMQGKEQLKKRFCIQNNRESYLINIPGTWYDRIILDTERHLIIPKLVSDYSMQYEDANQKSMMEGDVHDSFGWAISIYKEIGSYRLQLTFDEWKHVIFNIYGDTQKIASHFSITDTDAINESYVKISTLPYQLEKDIQSIKDEIKRVEKELKNLK